MALGFREIELKKHEEDSIFGIICNSMFLPEIGVYPNNNEWKTFEKGKVESLLQDSGVINVLPGEKGNCIIDDFIYGFFGVDDKNFPEKVMIEQFKYISGMPLDHSGRSVSFQKMFEIDGEFIEVYDNDFILSKLSILLEDTGVQYQVDIIGFDCDGRGILSINISLTPPHFISTAFFLMSHIKSVGLIFDEYLSFLNIKVNNEYSTMKILKFFGEIYFDN